jgi:hypothetical protein
MITWGWWNCPPFLNLMFVEPWFRPRYSKNLPLYCWDKRGFCSQHFQGLWCFMFSCHFHYMYCLTFFPQWPANCCTCICESWLLILHVYLFCACLHTCTYRCIPPMYAAKALTKCAYMFVVMWLQLRNWSNHAQVASRSMWSQLHNMTDHAHHVNRSTHIRKM